MECLVNDCKILLLGARFFYYFPQFWLPGERGRQIKPYLLHPAEQMAGAGKAFFVARVEVSVEVYEHGCSLLAAELFALDDPGQKGIGQDAAADHPPLYRGKLPLQAVKGLGIGYVTVIDQRMAAQFQAMAEALRVGCPLVELLAQPGMDDDLFQGIVIEPGQKGGQFIGVVEAQPGLDGELHGQPGQDVIEHGDDGVGIGQQAGAAAFTGDHGCRAAQVPVDMFIAKIVQAMRQRQQAVWFGMEKLRHHRQGLVFLGLQITKLPGIEV